MNEQTVAVKGAATMTPEMRQAGNYYRSIYRAIEPFLGSAILEIGAGFGSLAEHFVRNRKKYTGLDIDEKVIFDLSRKFHGHPSTHFLCGDLRNEAVSARIREMSVDTVVSMNVLEHVKDETGHLEALSRSVNDGTMVILIVPAFPFLYGTLDAQAGHLRRYTRRDLQTLCVKQGWEVLDMKYLSAVSAVGWFISGRILRQKLDGTATGKLTLLYDRVILPLSSGLDRVLTLLFGQSILCVARKKGDIALS